MLKVKFTGAIKGVTGSCTWLWHTESDTQMLVDCGMHQGAHEEEWNNRKAFEFDASQIKYVLLTHAHIDHCGLLPKLIKEGFSGWVYCTEATRDIAKEMLTDAARLSELFTLNDVEKINWHPIDKGAFRWKRPLRLEHNLCVTYIRGSHVLGACSLAISWAKKDGDKPDQFLGIHFTGDVGCQSEANPYLPLMKDDHYPFPSANYIVTESTYGNRVREPQSSNSRISRIGEILNRTLNRKSGKALIPVFAFHRMQELIADLCVLDACIRRGEIGWDGGNRTINVLCHSGLSNRLNAIYGEQLSKKLGNGKYQYLNNELPSRLGIEAERVSSIFKNLAEQGVSQFGNIRLVIPTERDKEKQLQQVDIVLATSGMCDNGASYDYFELMKGCSSNSVLITGFQSSGSVGRKLVDGDLEAVSCTAEVFDVSAFYSAHADQAKLIDNIFQIGEFAPQARPSTVFINHGDLSSKEGLQAKIKQVAEEKRQGYRAVTDVLIANDKWFDLNEGEYLSSEDPSSVDISQLSTIELMKEIERRQLAETTG